LPEEDDWREEQIQQREPRNVPGELRCEFSAFRRSTELRFEVPVVLEAREGTAKENKLDVDDEKLAEDVDVASNWDVELRRKHRLVHHRHEVVLEPGRFGFEWKLVGKTPPNSPQNAMIDVELSQVILVNAQLHL
jgi:hypothetical protein